MMPIYIEKADAKKGMLTVLGPNIFLKITNWKNAKNYYICYQIEAKAAINRILRYILVDSY